MKIHPLLYIGLLIVTASCNFREPKKDNKHDIFTDTLVYNYQTIQQRAPGCSGKTDSACIIVNIKYPVFKGKTVLNDSVKNEILRSFKIGKEPDTALNELAKHFISGYKVSTKGYKLQSGLKVVLQDSGLVALEHDGYLFQGGAHGSSFTGFINWNPKTNKKITLDDVLEDGSQEQFRKIAEHLFRKEEKLTDTSSLERDYFFKGGKFGLNDNYSFNPLGIRFIYNVYEIKPYAAGQTELIIPYTEIKTLIKPNSVITQFIK